MIIYKTTNLINNKFYVGKDTINNSNYFGSGFLIKKAINKYGIENFKKEILEKCETREELNIREIYWIKKTNAIELGYNITIGGTGGDTFTNNPRKEEIRTKLIGRHHTDETKKKISENNARLSGELHPNYKKKQSDETKKKRKETFLKNGFPMDGKNHSEESKEKNRLAHIGKKNIDKTEKKMSEIKKGKPKPKLKCPHCGKIGGYPQMIQWHFDKCKLK